LSIFDLDEPKALSALSIRVESLGIPISSYKNEFLVRNAIEAHINRWNPGILQSYHFLSDKYVIPIAASRGIPNVRYFLGVTQASWEMPLERNLPRLTLADDVVRIESTLEPYITRTLVVSQALRHTLQNVGLCQYNTKILYPPICNTPLLDHRYNDARTNLSDGTERAVGWTIGFPHRLEPVKNPDLFVEIAKALRTKVNARFVIVNHGSLACSVLEKIRNHNLESDFVILPSSEDIWARMPKLDALVLCSLSEGFPVTILEAMARKVLVFSVPVGGTTEILSHGSNAILVPKNTVENFVSAIESTLPQSERNLNICQRAADSVSTFAKNNPYQELLIETYNEILSY
jgi:glycosyltransferase involved in cell wall biosynthesis